MLSRRAILELLVGAAARGSVGISSLGFSRARFSRRVVAPAWAVRFSDGRSRPVPHRVDAGLHFFFFSVFWCPVGGVALRSGQFSRLCCSSWFRAVSAVLDSWSWRVPRRRPRGPASGDLRVDPGDSSTRPDLPVEVRDQPFDVLRRGVVLQLQFSVSPRRARPPRGHDGQRSTTTMIFARASRSASSAGAVSRTAVALLSRMRRGM